MKGARIIHNQTEKMLYFEDARLEFFGQPIAYLPYFSTPDPTVKRKSGFLIPSYSSSDRYGIGVEVPAVEQQCAARPDDRLLGGDEPEENVK